MARTYGCLTLLLRGSLLKRSTKSRVIGGSQVDPWRQLSFRISNVAPLHSTLSRGRQNWAAVVARLRPARSFEGHGHGEFGMADVLAGRAPEIIGGSERRFRAFRACHSDSIISTSILSPIRPLCCLRCYPVIAPLLCHCATMNVRLYAAMIERSIAFFFFFFSLLFDMRGLTMHGKEGMPRAIKRQKYRTFKSRYRRLCNYSEVDKRMLKYKTASIKYS